jgi:hypothetical protein
MTVKMKPKANRVYCSARSDEALTVEVGTHRMTEIASSFRALQ